MGLPEPRASAGRIPLRQLVAVWLERLRQRKMEINILDHRLKVSTIDKKDIHLFMSAIVKIAFIERQKHRCRFFSYTETSDDYSIVLDELSFADLPTCGGMRTAEDVWIPLVVSAGAAADAHGSVSAAAAASGIAKIAKSVIIPLADHDVSVHCLSTYQTDYVLVKERELQKACEVLAASFRITTEDATASAEVVVSPDRVRGGPGERGGSRLPPAGRGSSRRGAPLRPITHTFTSPRNTFVVASMDPDMLPAVCLPLLDLMFYSSLRPPRSQLPGQGQTETFFSLTLVGGEVSIVLDSESLQNFVPGVLFNTFETWKMVKIGDMPDGLGFIQCGVVAQMSDPIAEANISEYYISSYYYGHTLVPEEKYTVVLDLLQERASLTTETSNAVTS